MGENEKLLLEKAKNGDVEAFEHLIEGYQKKVYNIALRMIGNYDDAYDMAQETFIRVFRSIKNFKEQSSFSTWVYKITTNVCLDELRKRKNRNVVSLDDDIKLDNNEVKRQVQDDKPTPDVLVEMDELKNIVNDAINKLSGEHRTAIILRDIHGFSYEEISEIINCPQGTVKSRINRARRALKELLQTKTELLDIKYVKEK
jgi:RNA polymerase sigma-70 factor (ECF subfamily)